MVAFWVGSAVGFLAMFVLIITLLDSRGFVLNYARRRGWIAGTINLPTVPPAAKPAESKPLFPWFQRAEPAPARTSASTVPMPRKALGWRARRKQLEADHNSKQKERDRFYRPATRPIPEKPHVSTQTR